MTEILILTLGILVGLILSGFVTRDDYKYWREQNDNTFEWAMELSRKLTYARQQNAYLQGKLGEELK